MRRFLDILTSRRTSIALMAFVAVFGALGAWIPQSLISDTEAFTLWQTNNPSAARMAVSLGLHDIFSSWWFLTALAIFALVLAVATARLLRDAGRASRAVGRPTRVEIPGVRAEAVISRARELGYRERVGAGGRYVLTRHRIGLWASAILHVGMLLSLSWSAHMLAQTSAVIADFSQGQVRFPGDAYYAADDVEALPELGVPWRFDRMDATTWPTGGLKDVSATVSFLADDGTWHQQTTSVNRPLRTRGHTIYVQPAEFGDAAFLRIIDADGEEHLVRLEFFFAEPGQVSYAPQPYAVGDSAIEGRWDPFGVRDAKPLGLRPAGDDSATPLTLAPGETTEVAGLTVEFVGAAQWARFIVQRSPSVTPLFIGFAIIGLGSLMLYLWIPRELVLEETDDGVRYSWHAARMSRAYLSERDAILGLESLPDGDE